MFGTCNLSESQYLLVVSLWADVDEVAFLQLAASRSIMLSAGCGQKL